MQSEICRDFHIFIGPTKTDFLMIKNLIRFLLPVCAAWYAVNLPAQTPVWQPDNGDGTYSNPIIQSDYSDPDVIRVGDDYYMVASSFTCAPGIPVLHSKDLVNWTIVNHVYDRLPSGVYDWPAHGKGSWAPSIRFHNGQYYVYFCTPDEGLFVATAKSPTDKWTLTQMVHAAKWEDPCPFWDDDGNAYLVHSIHRGGPAILHRMSPDGMRLLDNGVTVYHDIEENPVLEGLKMMKRGGWYYILAPAGGVPTGWQTVLRSRNIYGPYEPKRVLDIGDNGVNGPHQGGLVETQTGEWWFVHFQDKGAYGRVTHLQPAEWKDGWPVIGDDPDGDGCGTPVLSHRKPNVGKSWPTAAPQTSDEFDSPVLGLQWQWQAAARPAWYSLSATPGQIRLYAEPCPSEQGNLYYAGNLLLQKLPAPEFTATAKLETNLTDTGERAGLIVMGNAYSYIALCRTETGNRIALYEGRYDRLAVVPEEIASIPVHGNTVWFRVQVNGTIPAATDDPRDPRTPVVSCVYSYSTDGVTYTDFRHTSVVSPGGWIGAKVGIFSSSPNIVPGKGYADFDYFRLSR